MQLSTVNPFCREKSSVKKRVFLGLNDFNTLMANKNSLRSLNFQYSTPKAEASLLTCKQLDSILESKATKQRH